MEKTASGAGIIRPNAAKQPDSDCILPWLFQELGRLAASGKKTGEMEAEFPGLARALQPFLAELEANYPLTRPSLPVLKKILNLLESGQKLSGNGHNNIEKKWGEAADDDNAVGERTECGRGAEGEEGQNYENGEIGEGDEGSGEFQPLRSPDSSLPRVGAGAGRGVPKRRDNILTESELAEARRLSLLLKSRLQSYLQTQTVKVNHPGCRGRLDPGSLYKLSIGGSKVFRRSGSRVSLDTGVYLLLDASGSMEGKIHLVNLAAYGLADACQGPPGLTLSVGVFPANDWESYHYKNPDAGSVVREILRPGERLHRGFKFEAGGGTPLAQALRQITQQIAAWRQRRKVVIILTDGQPESPEDARAALDEMSKAGLEVFGLGLQDDSILDFLPASSAVIENLTSLPAGLFRLLGEALKLR